jgi:hypothetical protein
MTEFKALVELVSKSEQAVATARDPAAQIGDPMARYNECKELFDKLVESQPRLERMTTKAAVKDPDMRIYSDAMVEKILALATRYETVFEDIKGTIQFLQPAAEAATGMADNARRYAFCSVEITSRGQMEALEGQSRQEVAGYELHARVESMALERRRVALEEHQAALVREEERRTEEAAAIITFRSRGRVKALLAEVFRRTKASDLSRIITALCIVLENIVKYPEAEGTRTLRCLNPNYVRDFGNDDTEWALFAIGYDPVYGLEGQRSLVLQEPLMMTTDPAEVEAWMLWFDERRELLDIFKLLEKNQDTVSHEKIAGLLC